VIRCDDGLMQLIISAGSDIGFAMAKSWARRGLKTVGTYRTARDRKPLKAIGVVPIRCELTSSRSINRAARAISTIAREEKLSTVVFATGTMEPIGRFGSVLFKKWVRSFEVNFISQAHFLHKILGSLEKGAKVVFFAGGGTNNAPTNYSAYILSKIVLIKFSELLSKEYPDYGFFSAGPGWVNTKIHQQTLEAGAEAGDNLEQTINRISDSDFINMDKVVERMSRLIDFNQSVTSGRNFSLANDPLDDPTLLARLEIDQDMYKLRRSGNGMFLEPRD